MSQFKFNYNIWAVQTAWYNHDHAATEGEIPINRWRFTFEVLRSWLKQRRVRRNTVKHLVNAGTALALALGITAIRPAVAEKPHEITQDELICVWKPAIWCNPGSNGSGE